MKETITIIIVDDDPDDREVIRDAFRTVLKDQHFIGIENGDKLLDYLEQHTSGTLPQLILLDLNMPAKDGREVLKELKADSRYKTIPTIVFTTSSSTRDKQIAYSLGANCFLTKPDTYDKLIDLAQCISKLWL